MVRRNCIAQAPMARVRDPVNGVSAFPLATRRARERAEMHVMMLIIWVLLRVPAEVGAADARPPTKGETRSIALILSDAAHEAIALDLATRLRGMQLMAISISANTAVCAEDLAALARAAAGAHQVAHIAPVLVGPGTGVDHAFWPTEERLQGLPITLHHGVACHHGVTLDHDRAAPDTGAYAIFLSSDGGWANFDQHVAARLSAQSVPVVGVSTRGYLWAERSPQDIAQNMARLDADIAPRLGRAWVLLVGVFRRGERDAVLCAAAAGPGEGAGCGAGAGVARGAHGG
jgi:hypothetical protein